MSESEKPAELAEDEFFEALGRCGNSGSQEENVEALWHAVERWVALPHFKESLDMQIELLNELTFALADPGKSAAAWESLRRLAAKWEVEGEDQLKEIVRISTFEVLAEAPACPASSIRLFSLATDPLTRWAVFAAYENVPWRLRPHAAKYSGGTVSDADCDEWLASRNLGDDDILMARIPRNEM